MNKKHTLISGILLLFGAIIVTACTVQTEAAAMEEMDMDTSLGNEAEEEHTEDDDHHHDDMAHVHIDPPAEFASLTNPFAADHEAIEAGEETYNTLCATCHGPQGNGDGPGAESLDPKPASLSDGMMMNELSDGYLFWRVSKGGMMEPFNSAMPAWETGLTEEQRWQVISYVRTLAGDGDAHMEDSHTEDEHDDHMDMEDDHDDHVEDDHDDHVEDTHTEDHHEDGDTHDD